MGPTLLALAPRLEWYGGWSPPFRYPLVLLPLLALWTIPVWRERHRPGLRLAITFLGAATFVLMVSWVALPGWTYNFADGRTLWLDHLAQRTGLDLVRWLPSTVRPRAAAWVWPLLSFLALPLLLWRPTGHWRRFWNRRFAEGLGIAALLVALPVAAQLVSHWPSSVVELEDPWVAHVRGAPFPHTWKMQRVGYRGGWRLNEGSRAVVPVKPGGARARVLVDLRVAFGEESYTLDFLMGETPLGTVEIEAGPWRRVDLGTVDWPPGAPLIITAPEGPPRWEGGAVVDRIFIEWLDP